MGSNGSKSARLSKSTKEKSGKVKTKKYQNPNSKVTDQDKAILELKKQRDSLRQFQKGLRIHSDRDYEIVKRLLIDGKRERAKHVLKKRKFRQVLLERSNKQLDTIDEICGTLEFAQIEIIVIESLKEGNEALKKIYREMMSLEEIERIMEETMENYEQQKEITGLLGRHLTAEDIQNVEIELDTILNEEKKQEPAENSKEKQEQNLPDAFNSPPTNVAPLAPSIHVSKLVFPKVPHEDFPSMAHMNQIQEEDKSLQPTEQREEATASGKNTYAKIHKQVQIPKETEDEYANLPEVPKSPIDSSDEQAQKQLKIDTVLEMELDIDESSTLTKKKVDKKQKEITSTSF